MEKIMEATIKEEKETTVREEKKGKRKWLNRFLNFLIYGGWLLIVVFIAGIITLISVLSK
jgi:multisubunit Na+/H+ antiporter MnhB subunit